MRACLLTLALVLALPAFANASQIAVGLDWQHQVFVQEIWQQGKARYVIYNARPNKIKLAVSEVLFVNVPATESFRAIDGQELAGWVVESKDMILVDAPPAPANDSLRYLRFRIVDGPRLGLLSYPTAPADLPKGKIVSYVGVNGSGGRRFDAFYEQEPFTFESNGTIEVKLTLPAHGETVTFHKKQGTAHLSEAIISSAECATLPIQSDNEKITIDTSNPLKAAMVHTVTLRFTAPKVDALTMAAIDGWVSLPATMAGTSGGSYHLVRGLMIQPKK